MEYIIAFILLFKILTKENNLLLFKLQTFQSNNLNNNISSIFDTLKKAYIYTKIKIGEPEHQIECKLSMHTPHFFMLYTEEKNNEKNNNKKYDINKSITFKNVSCLNQLYVQTNKDIHAKEKFIMNIYDINNKSNNEIIINDLDFVLGVKYHKKENYTETYYLTIGLQTFTSNQFIQRNKFNFINNLKSLNIIDNYIWSIYYNTEKLKEDELNSLDNLLDIEQTLLIGDFPHEYKPHEFSKEQLYYAYTNTFLWSFKFKSIIIQESTIKHSLHNSNCQINFNEFLIYAPYNYVTYVKNYFFDYFISRNICHIYLDEDADLIYCDKSKDFNINHLKEFPKLYFEHNEFNYTFEFSYKDLFAEIDNKYIFLIGNMINDVDDWFLGRIFFRKYQFVFNTDSKAIGFYNPNIKWFKSIKNETKNDTIEIIYNGGSNGKHLIFVGILCSLLIISVIVIFVFVFKNQRNKKRKRANELDDEYDYVSDNKNIN